MNAFVLPDWPNTSNGAITAALNFDYRQSADDFVVTENLGFEPSGEGEHTLLFVEKNNLTTFQLREYLAQRFKLPAMHIGYSGLKDKLAITQQWFSLSKKIDIELETDIALGKGSFKVLRAESHHRKLKIGTHKSNQFKLVLRNLKLDGSDDAEAISDYLDKKITQIKRVGFPNYFGPQRFGHNAGNIQKALDWFSGGKKISREKQSLYLSSARSFIFNELLAKRVIENTWNQYREEDKLILKGSQSFFSIDPKNIAELEDIRRRLEEGDIAIAGPMLGQAGDLNSTQTETLGQSNQADIITSLILGLEKHQAKTLYRPLGIRPSGLEAVVEYDNQNTPTIELVFDLSRGAFATALLSAIGNPG